MSFDSIPILDLSQARDPSSKPAFLLDLRHALLEVGFLYIKNTGIDSKLIQDVITEGKRFFDLPTEKKLEIEMKNAPSFLGYSKLGNEITRFKTDWREQIDLSTNHPLPSSSDPLYHNLLAPNQWPDEQSIPRFRPVYEEYMKKMGAISMEFISLVAEAIGLPSDAFNRFFDADQQHKLKIVKYPDLEELGIDGDVEQQGVGPHKDSMLTSYLLQASHHRGLQVQNHRGEWIDCPPIDGTLVVAIGQGLEAITQGVCQSTTHRVLSPARGSGARYSVPFFQGVSYDATFESMEVPEHVKALRQEVIQKNGIREDDIEFTFSKGRWGHLGEATLMNRVKSHPDVGERWYPTLLQKIREEQARNNQVSEIPQGILKDQAQGQAQSVKAH
ncbi:hypothetical protein D8B26_000115 [Coccidioides posadasii str. Silveira]|uniref:Isopenicillin N synthetase, putative n=1 Tax=Coccidioides posadasii (strain C735) TaxID=222929 RepID=C5PC95_COCP7|nr:isopenicillin N synthetase, putative [Coccidioides posadasii C735 delta SOWgp]EER25572.1 isopenicillin N synthetase, putative [Coccidioides posadasii C735 delta SOWgp]QVM05404.1 hypothetical protein D8B26_000115 [Coccidioides posadasii str. Silveira]|eukprot:XP_003067717.1 isopenicillin N synthetase, putative [Coccidioides posadasii C735 delta SOWgp]